MGSESSSSPNGKRFRDPEDEVYVDNLHSHKRYLSEIMASSLNGLKVGDPLPENLMESPARSESMGYPRDEISSQYSPMSEDYEDSRYCGTPINTSSVQPDSLPTSPVSPYRYQKPLNGFSSTAPTTSYPSVGCTLTAVACSQTRQRGSDSEGRLPSSPSDICHSADLRRAALMRSVQMRTQSPGPPSFELPFAPVQESMHDIEAEEQSCLCVKSLVDEREYQNPRQDSNLFIEECSSMGISEPEFSRVKSCRVLNMNAKGEESGDEVFGGNGTGRTALLSSRRSVLGGNSKACGDFK
ncbi:hypothetical protein HHK36_012317 [Tetracentron sinense]|uniref:Uncharacterized protein n=1 Tax=Tetracentron sinense TaxID=13715 RepID=A0A834Z909_TETSI|nr:hypothetical protein HHK36_012301 [Tetracentron sinense]KAF8401379.1 hypothetical protein HHK36_012317 [Tetracentron sinense]